MAKLRGVRVTLPLDKRSFDTWLKRDLTHAQPLILLSFALNLLYDPKAQAVITRRACGPRRRWVSNDLTDRSNARLH